jgi:multidrug efflux pump
VGRTGQGARPDPRVFRDQGKGALVDGVFTVTGFSFGGRGQSSGLAFIHLKDWSERPGAQNRVQAIAGRAMGYFSTIKDAMAFAFAPPAVLELGNATGFDFELLDRGGVGHEKLMEARNQLLGLAAKDPTLMAVRPNGLDDEPQYRFAIDREKASAFGLTIEDINNTLSAAWGSGYVNDFIDRGRVKRVFIQGDESSRMLPQDFNKWYVRNNLGQMVPFSAFRHRFVDLRLAQAGALQRRSLGGNSRGMPAPGQSTGAAMAAMEKAGGASCPRASPTSGPPFPTRSRRPARRSARFTPSPSPSSSSAWPRSTKAGRFRSPSCWWCRSASSARSWPPCCGA